MKYFYTLVLLLTTHLFANSAEDEIIETGQFLNKSGLCPATSGNISVRTSTDEVAITASGKHKGELTSDDILIVDLNGKPIGGSKKPSAETLLHTVLYANNENIGAVIHTNSLNGTVLTRFFAYQNAFITEGYEIHKAFPGITTHQSEVVIPIFENSQDMVALSKEVTLYLQAHPDTFGFLIRGHGLYTWGRTMREAKIRVEAFEYLFECELKLRTLRQ